MKQRSPAFAESIHGPCYRKMSGRHLESPSCNTVTFIKGEKKTTENRRLRLWKRLPLLRRLPSGTFRLQACLCETRLDGIEPGGIKPTQSQTTQPQTTQPQPRRKPQGAT